MNDTPPPSLDDILRACAAGAPNPLYPADYAQAAGVPRDRLDAALDQLRMAGLLRLTDWVQGRGQGYALTEAGTEAIRSSRTLGQLREGKVPARPQPAPGPRRNDGGAPTAWERGEAAREALLTRGVPWVTVSLIAINVLWWFWGLNLAKQQNVPTGAYVGTFLGMGGQGVRLDPVLRQEGAMEGYLFYVRHQWWRLLTCAFVHIGLTHLGMNMLFLYWVGPFLEQVWGHVRFAILYLVCIIGGSCGMLIDQPLGLAAGASGALWGIFASFATWLFLNRRSLPQPLVMGYARNIIIFFIINIAFTYGVPGISKGGHFGGGIAGILAGLPLDYARFARGWRRWLAVVGVLAVPAVALGFTYYYLDGKGGSPLRRAISSAETERQELEEVNRRYVRPINQSTAAALHFYHRTARPLLLARDAQADAARKALPGVRARVAALQAVHQEVDRAGPFTSDIIRSDLDIGARYVDATRQLLELAQSGLEAVAEIQKPPATEQFQELEDQVKQAKERWEALLTKE